MAAAWSSLVLNALAETVTLSRVIRRFRRCGGPTICGRIRPTGADGTGPRSRFVVASASTLGGSRALLASNPVVPERSKFVFVTGGVASGLGKGITAASLGRLLKSRGLRVTLQKLDPYINVDPGTMNPFEHGEVFVLDDGAETDLDLGHYERFTDESLHRGVERDHRRRLPDGDRQGAAGRVPGQDRAGHPPHHQRDQGPNPRARRRPTEADVAIVEVGGTVGDIESLPFLEAIRQFRNEVGRENVAFVHVSLMPFIGPTGELKTKPTQHSVRELRSIGIQPDVIVCRSDRPINPHLKEKISLLCDVETRGRRLRAWTRTRSTRSR